MSTNMTTSEVRMLPLAALTFSTTKAQVERREHLDKTKLDELADSIKTAGVLQAILVRPRFKDDHGELNQWEVVAGERRAIAAKKAGLKMIPASVRELTDEQVYELQLIENLQRQDLHELAEAEGYEALAKRGHSVEDMAAKVGKSKGYVYARMKLLALGPAARDAFYRGELSSSTAVLLARMPDPASQRKACGEILHARYDGGPMTYRESFEHIQRNYMLKLADAPFPTHDTTLIPKVGNCGACPKRTGNQPELFGDVKGADICTDPACFKRKREAHAKRVLEEAKASGQEVISGHDAKKIAPHGLEHGGYLNGGFVRLEDKVYRDPKNRTAAQIMGKDFKPTLVQDTETGDLVPVVRESKLNEQLGKQGVRAKREPSNPTEAAAQKKARRERDFRQALYLAVREKLPDSLDLEALRAVAIAFWRRQENELQKQILALWEWAPKKSSQFQAVEEGGVEQIANLNGEQLAVFLQDMTFASELRVSPWSIGKPTQLLAAAKRYKVNAEKVRRDLEGVKELRNAKRKGPKKAPAARKGK